MKIRQLLCWLFLAVLLATGGTALAQTVPDGLRNISQAEVQRQSATLLPLGNAPGNLLSSPNVTRIKSGKPSLRTDAKYKKQTATNLNDYVGNRTAIAHLTDGHILTDEVSVSKTSDTELLITGLFYNEAEVKATVDLNTGALTIPPQHLFYIKGTDDDMMKISIGRMDMSTYGMDNIHPIEGFLKDGDIHIESTFAYFVTEGPKKDMYLTMPGLMDYADCATPNGIQRNVEISFKDGAMTKNNRQTRTVEDWIYVRQLSDDAIRVSHVRDTLSLESLPAGHAYIAMDVRLNPENKVQLDPQPLWVDNSSGYTFNFGSYKLDEVAKGVFINVKAITTSPVEGTAEVVGDSTVINLGKWMEASVTGGKVENYNALFESSRFSTTCPIQFPATPQANFEGDGTESSPYLIKTVDDWYTLAMLSKTDSSVRGAKTTFTNIDGKEGFYYPIYEGKHFKLAGDIDFSIVNKIIDPIGNDSLYFAGVLDGAGHTLVNLTYKNYPYSNFGLFAGIGKAGEIKNFTVDKANISSLGGNVGVLAGVSLGFIRNIAICNSSVKANYGYYAGGVAGKALGTISNVNLTAVTVSGLGNVGGISGFSTSTIDSAIATDVSVRFVEKRTYNGGLVGTLNGTNRTTAAMISNSSFSGTVGGTNTAEVSMGGLVGYAESAEIKESHALVDIIGISASKCNIGALAGAVAGANMHDCYASGSLRNPNSTRVGGLVGASLDSPTNDGGGTTIANCYSSVYLDTYSSDSLRGIIGSSTNLVTIKDVYYDEQIAAVPHKVYGLSTAELTTGSGLQGLDAAKWEFADGLYPRLKGDKLDDEAVLVSVTPLRLATNNDTRLVVKDFTYRNAENVNWKAVRNGSYDEKGGYAFTFDNGTGKLNGELHTDTIVASLGTASKTFVLGIAPMPFDGDGTEQNPWLIKSKSDLESLSSIATKANINFANKYFKQTANIDMKGEEFTPICKSSSDDFRFEGVYDGGGYKISNMVIRAVAFDEDGVVDPSSDDSYARSGLFAIVGVAGVVKNLTIDSSCKFEYYDTGGAIAGRMYGRIENCKNYAVVKCYYSLAGGIVGELCGNGVVTGCLNAGNIYAGIYAAGGIVGGIASEGASIENCTNTAEVGAVYLNPYEDAGEQYNAGGIVGEATYGGHLVNVCNSGHVISYENVGGIVGVARDVEIENAVNYGYITEPDDLTTGGAIVGYNKSGVTIKGTYFDKKLNKLGAVGNAGKKGATPLTTSELITPNLNLSEDFWYQTAGKYPVLKWAKDDETQQLASLATVLFDEADNITYVHKPAELGNVSVVKYSLKKGNVFSINGSSLDVKVPETGLASDTLVASYGNSSKYLPLKTLNAKVLDGDGSKQSPYLINNAEDFLKLAAFVNASLFDYDGSYFKATADLDFADKAFTPLADGDASFKGVLDGGGHAIKNIVFDATTETSSSNKGFVGNLGANGLLCNFTMDASSSFTGEDNIGAFVGNLYGSVDSLINKADVSGSSAVGGIAGYLYPFAIITNSSNEGNVTGSSRYVGGIAGESEDIAEAVISNVTNTGRVSGTNSIGGIAGRVSASIVRAVNKGALVSEDSYIGGIVGSALYPTSVRNSHNEGAIDSAYSEAGGIIGMAERHYDNQPLVVDSTYNIGLIRTRGGGYTGGIIGDTYGGVIISNSYNTAEINGSEEDSDEGGGYATVTSDASRWTAGILGYAKGEEGASVKLTGCYNTGRVIGRYKVAGIVGELLGDNDLALVENCHNTGDILSRDEEDAYAGGIVGSGECNILDSWNSGKVMSFGGAFGGVAGSLEGSHPTLERCFNVGNVESLTIDGNASENAIHAGGLVGDGNPTVKSCYNFGTISAYDYAAGLVGCPSSGDDVAETAKVSYSYTAAKVSVAKADGEWAMTIGKSEEESAVGVQASNVYFDTSFGNASEQDNIIDGVNGVTTRQLTQLELGEDFSTAVATYPSLVKQADNEVNSFYVATVLFAENESASNVLNDFLVGTPNGVAWSSSDNLIVEGNNVRLNNEAVGENATLTVTAGNLHRTYELVINNVHTGITDTRYGSTSVAARVYYDAAGRIIANPSDAEGIVIEKTIYEDGRISTRKVVTRNR